MRVARFYRVVYLSFVAEALKLNHEQTCSISKNVQQNHVKTLFTKEVYQYIL